MCILKPLEDVMRALCDARINEEEAIRKIAALGECSETAAKFTFNILCKVICNEAKERDLFGV